MDWAAIITFARNQSGVSSNNITDAILLTYLNIAREQIRVRIEDKVAQEYFWDILTFDTVANQAEYTLQTITGTTQEVDKISKIEIKFNSNDSYHTLVRGGTDSQSNFSDEYLGDNTPQSKSFWQYRDGSIFVYPTPTGAVTSGGRIYANLTLADITALSTADDIFPNHPELVNWHHVVAMGAIPFMMRHRNVKDSNDIKDAIELYEYELEKMIKHLNTKYDSYVQGELPSSLYYSE